MGQWEKYCAPMDMPLAILCLVLNLIIPGIGSILNGLMGEPRNRNAIIIGIVALVCILLGGIGWVLALIHSILIILEANR